MIDSSKIINFRNLPVDAIEDFIKKRDFTALSKFLNECRAREFESVAAGIQNTLFFCCLLKEAIHHVDEKRLIRLHSRFCSLRRERERFLLLNKKWYSPTLTVATIFKNCDARFKNRRK